MAITLRFLGTGAAGGTPGTGRSRRRESSLLVSDETHVLIDVTRDFEEQARAVPSIDAILLTHGHAYASGGFAQLRRWWTDGEPIPVLAAPATIEALARRHRRLDHCRFVRVLPSQRRRIAGWTASCIAVPHAPDETRFPTYAWKLTQRGRRLVYASDVAALTRDLARFCRGIDLLVIDGATYRRRIFSHLRIDADLPRLCDWPVDRILLTQIGRSVPPHERLEEIATELCPQARPAYDGLEVEI